MKLYTWPTSPFGCKVKAVAAACNLKNDIEIMLYHPWQDDHELRLKNPLNKIPVLVDDGFVLYDSPVICEYLIQKAKADHLLAQSERWVILRQQALSDGILDAAISARYETHFRPAQIRSHDWYVRQMQAVVCGVEIIADEDLPLNITLGGISMAITLAYLKLRYADLTWDVDFPELLKWYEVYIKYPCIAENLPLDNTPLPKNLMALER
jgi:glutathione S-transferase